MFNLKAAAETDPTCKAYYTAMQIEKSLWRAREWMAWFALAGLLMGGVAVFFVMKPAQIAATENLIIWFDVTMTSVIGIYFGSATMAGQKLPSWLDPSKIINEIKSLGPKI